MGLGFGITFGQLYECLFPFVGVVVVDSVDDSRFYIVGSQLKSFMNVRSRSVDVLGDKVDYLERGQGIPVVFLHGFSCNKSNWRGVMHRFPSDRYRLIAPDLPGFCLAKLDPGRNYSGKYYLDWMNEFMDALAIDQCHLLAHSTSTLIAMYYAPLNNDRLLSLTLANMPDTLLPAAKDDGGIVEEFFESLKVNSGDEWYQMVSALFYRPPSIPRFLREYNHKVFDQKLRLADNFFDACLRIRPQLISKSKLIDCPVLLITSDHDVYAPGDFAKRMDSNFKAMSTLELKQCGHMSYLEKQTDFVNGLVSSLDAISPCAVNSPLCLEE